MRKVLESPENSPVLSTEKHLERQKASDTGETASLTGVELFWQRSLGNHYLQSTLVNKSIQPKISATNGGAAIQRKCSCGGTCASCSAKDDEKIIQPKLKIGPANDVYEQEADRVADQVMRMPEPVVQAENDQPYPGIHIQRISADDSAGFDTDITLDQSGSRPLSDATRSYMEPRFGIDFSHVRMHTDQQAQQTALKIQARAFTYGHGIWLGKGESEGDKNLLAHELTHVVQQGASSSSDKNSSAAVNRSMTASQVQLARLPCTNRKKIDVYPVNLPGSTRTIFDDIATINSVFCQCGIEINVVNGQSVQTNVLALDPPVGSLNASGAAPSRELSQLLQIRPGGNMIHAYYVPAISGGALATSVGSTRFSPSLPDSLIVTNGAGAVPIIAAHELGHVLLDSGAHHPTRDNLMAAGSSNSGAGDLEQTQCNRMP